MLGFEWIKPVITDVAKLKREAVKRRRPHNELSVSNSSVPDYIKNGWRVQREMKYRCRIRKEWSHDEKLENRVWSLLYLLGYPELGELRNLHITIKRKATDAYKKQIDIFAKDDETVIVAECKSSDKISRRSLQKDIGEFESLKGPIANAIKNHYGPTYKPKIIWLFITNNFAWSRQDRQRAVGARFNIITERELNYYIQIANHLRSAARFQFLAEFLKDQKIPEMENVCVPAVRGKLGGRYFYSFVSTPKQLLKIAFVNHRSLNDPDGAPTYQRLVNRTRLRQIGRYILKGGYFPTNILVNFTTKCRFDRIDKSPETDVVFGRLYLPCRYRSAWIIDGQHRLYGYAPLPEEYLCQNIMVTAFERMKKEDEADLFVTINHEQKSVPKTLLDDLEGELKWGSKLPTERIGAVGARLIGILNNDIAEPLYGRVTQQGINATDRTCLTVPALKDGLRRSGLIGEAILKKREFLPGPLCGTNDNETLDRAHWILTRFFQLLKNANPSQWESGRSGYLCTNVALQAYLKLLGELIKSGESKTGLDAREREPNEIVVQIEEYLQPILNWLCGADPIQMERTFKVQYGSGGPIEYFFRLCQIVRNSFSDFSPEGLDEWTEAQSEERIAEADLKLKELNIRVQKAIFDILKQKYGFENNAYWNKGIADKKIKARAYEKSLDDDQEDPLPPENYLDFIDFKKIVENRTHWPLFKAIFDIPEKGEKGYSKNLRWMDRINELRRIPAHPTEVRNYKSTDFDYINYVHDAFHKKLEAASIPVVTSDGL